VVGLSEAEPMGGRVSLAIEDCASRVAIRDAVGTLASNLLKLVPLHFTTRLSSPFLRLFTSSFLCPTRVATYYGVTSILPTYRSDIPVSCSIWCSSVVPWFLYNALRHDTPATDRDIEARPRLSPRTTRPHSSPRHSPSISTTQSMASHVDAH
jgi:hypothetical protein